MGYYTPVKYGDELVGDRGLRENVLMIGRKSYPTLTRLATESEKSKVEKKITPRGWGNVW